MASADRIFGLSDPPNDKPEPRLLVEWESPSRAFAGSLAALFQRTDSPSFNTAEFWPDVFVHRPLPLRFLFDSYALHILAVLIVYALTLYQLIGRRPQPTLSAYNNTHIEYYSVSEYLPPIAAKPLSAKIPQKGQPAYSKQEIISVPPDADNSRQTIVTPDLRILKKDVKLPNIAAWGERAAPIQPLDNSLSGGTPKLLLPPEIIAPPPDPVASSRKNLLQSPDVVQPAPDLQAKNRAPGQLQPSIVGPPPTIENVRPLGAMNIANLTPSVAEPNLPVPEQRSTGAPGSADAGGRSAHDVPPPPSAQAIGGHGKAQGQLLALSIEPAEVKGPVEVPQGSRKGVFATSPEGKPGAPGIPEITPGGGTANGAGHGSPSGKTDDRLAGIYVAPAPNVPSGGAVVAKAEPKPAPDPAVRDKLLAAMHNATKDIPRQPAAPANPAVKVGGGGKIEQQVFGEKRYYSMILNMPNFNSTAGSWIIRFAELKPTADKADLSAPLAVNKVDPAYPQELMRDKVEGTVVLYAIIRADGSVDSIRVLNSVDDRLDQNAISALSRWHFRPGEKQGQPVDVEAVVQIPFRLARL